MPHKVNMHTDLVISDGGNGSVTLTGKDKDGKKHSVTITNLTAHLAHAKAGGRLFNAAVPPPQGMTPFNMHTDGQVHGDSSGVTITGQASKDGEDGELTVTIDGPALAELKATHAGL